MPKMKKVSTPKLSLQERKIFAGLVEEHPSIWDQTHPHHRHKGSVYAAWESIAHKMGLSIADCKKVWKSLKDALRYQQSLKSKLKLQPSECSATDSSESQLNEPDPNTTESPIDEWEMWDVLKFLVNKSDGVMYGFKIRTQTNPAPSSMAATDSSESMPLEMGNSDANELHQKAEYPPPPETTIVPDQLPEPAHNGLSSHYNYMPSYHHVRKDRKVDAEKPGNADELHYRSMWSNLDRMFRKLPASVAEDLNVQFINLAYTEVKRYEHSIYIESE